MTMFHPSWLEPKLTLDGGATLVAGLIAFIGGLLAYLAVRGQTKAAGVALQTQLDAEKKTRAEQENTRLKAVATALLFEIDHHYKSNVRDLLEAFEKEKDASSPPVVVKPMTVNPFPIYVGNTSALGALPAALVEAIVGYYGVMQIYLSTLTQYTQGYNLMLRGDAQLGYALMKNLVPRIKSEARAMIQLTYTTCGLLCYFTATEFSSPRIGVASDSTVQDAWRSTLEDAKKAIGSDPGM
jgi:hypothetical protein